MQQEGRAAKKVGCCSGKRKRSLYECGKVHTTHFRHQAEDRSRENALRRGELRESAGTCGSGSTVVGPRMGQRWGGHEEKEKGHPYIRWLRNRQDCKSRESHSLLEKANGLLRD